MAGAMRDKETITPLIKLAIQLLPRAFFYMYPFPFSLRIHKTSNLVVLERKPGFLKFIPWCLSLICITGVAGVGSCTYITLSYAFNFRISSANNPPEIQLLDVIIAVGGGISAITEIATMLMLFRYPELIQGFNRLVELERHCKIIFFK